MTRVAAVGECMLELRHVDHETLALGFGGDTLNTAVYLARCGRRDGIQVDYVTALGDDPYSEAMIEAWRREGIGTDRVVRLRGRHPGLYLIRTDEAGERSFTYYRSESAARDMFRVAGARLDESLSEYDLVYLSGITLSILDAPSRERLWTALDAVRDAGGRVAFDTNYRPWGWPDAEASRLAVRRTLERTDIALPTLDDERQLFGDDDEDACVERLLSVGCQEVAVKLGADGTFVATRGGRWRVPAATPDRVVDTTAAGDAFNGAYLAVRMANGDPESAAIVGNRLAAVVIGHAGAVIPAAAMPHAAPPSPSR
jgi:2-dehydro-3-deoxygluconokinase